MIKEDKITVAVRLPESEYKTFEEFCDKNYITQTMMIRIAILQAMTEGIKIPGNKEEC